MTNSSYEEAGRILVEKAKVLDAIDQTVKIINRKGSTIVVRTAWKVLHALNEELITMNKRLLELSEELGINLFRIVEGQEDKMAGKLVYAKITIDNLIIAIARREAEGSHEQAEGIRSLFGIYLTSEVEEKIRVEREAYKQFLQTIQ